MKTLVIIMLVLVCFLIVANIALDIYRRVRKKKNKIEKGKEK